MPAPIDAGAYAVNVNAYTGWFLIGLTMAVAAGIILYLLKFKKR